MKKIFQIVLLFIGLSGCASFEFEDLATPESETARILSLGLSHAENLSEAEKLSGSHMIAVVSGKLIQAEDQKNKTVISAVNIAKYSDNVKVKEGDSEFKFEGFEISEIISMGILNEPVYLDYYLKGLKDKNTGLIQHVLHLSIKYTFKQRRNYSSASFCDKWQGCENADKVDIRLISSSAAGCTPSSCQYTEIMELNLSDAFLRSNKEENFSISFNSPKASNEITISSDYLNGYLQVVN